MGTKLGCTLAAPASPLTLSVRRKRSYSRWPRSASRTGTVPADSRGEECGIWVK